ncbi:MAG TPA: ATP-grasp domain-containing protein, partial [Beutenbergiaceae bacterium]|nr:ATP-grasp domain-containing protein [Beutenbergiaceae bacterium]
RIAHTIASTLEVTGVLAVEMFYTSTGELLVNELAMRPHNSGHLTIEGSRTSQFEQHLRAVLDLPLGATQPTSSHSVMVNVLGSSLSDPRQAYPELMRRYPEVKTHVYGKQVRPRRKLGHVTVTGQDPERMVARAQAAVALLQGNGQQEA